jgi:heme-degrading monooxygenase HmoA
MIARVWSARATCAGAPQYVEYFTAHVLPELAAISGYEGAKVLTSDRDSAVDIVVITWWTSLEAIRAFAGDAIDNAVIHPAAAALLTGFDRDVKHYAVAVDDRRDSSAGRP